MLWADRLWINRVFTACFGIIVVFLAGGVLHCWLSVGWLRAGMMLPLRLFRSRNFAGKRIIDLFLLQRWVQVFFFFL